MARNIVNIVNFIRGVEPREAIDLVKPVVKQLELLKKHHLPGTFLFQYDALCDTAFTSLFPQKKEDIELGVWLEIVEPMAREAGIAWRGRYAWDWHAHCGFSVGYTKAEREKLADLLMEKFKSVFGYYPRSMGSWVIDAHTLLYVCEKYGLDASCNCKDQWGTDGYTMWGGYYNQAYYPAKNNMFCPAQTQNGQIPVPVFRMLGSDPIYQYDFGLDVTAAASENQGVVTLEPVYTGISGGGGSPKWVDWYLKENFNGKTPHFAYTQAGQENSFGWEKMEKGLVYQVERMAELVQEGKLEVETLGASGRWFKQTFDVTPPTAITVESDWAGQGKSTFWYNCKNYRINLLFEKDAFRIRDLYIFREGYEEIYHKEVCTDEYLVFDNLSVVDGNRFSGNGVLAGLYPKAEGKALGFTQFNYSQQGEDVTLSVLGTSVGTLTFVFTQSGITVTSASGSDFAFDFVQNEHAAGLPAKAMQGERMSLAHKGFDYVVAVLKGSAYENKLASEGGSLMLDLSK